ncbi:MAG: sugar phosphate isomerase/epimerase [Acidobacteria bacterium]|nr:sugar phosphate isomerase/epimerase [Acidobacteriota bacterium]MBI3471613.1 sugar phosphate isomerase/epimerase [Candidatus Solibacter usitatus]
MDRVVSTHVAVSHRLTVAWLNKAMQAGIPAVEIFCARQHFDYHNKSQIAEMGHWFRDAELRLHSLHLPMYNDEYWGRSGPQAVITLTEPVKSKRIASIDEVKRALDVAEVIPYKYGVQHLGVSGEEYDDRKIEAAFTALEELTIFARQRGVEILLENIPNRLSTAERLVQFNEATHLHMNFVLDVGHANLDEGVASAYRIMRDRIRSTHVHDNDGQADTHLFPLLAGGGTVNWPETMKLLRSRPGQYPLLLELREVPGMENPLAAINQVFDRLEELPDPGNDQS